MSDSASKDPPTTEEETSPISSLLPELRLSCLGRVLRSDHAALSLVSKKYQSLVNSHELYTTRSLLGNTQECLYICLTTKPNSAPSWFTLHRENATVNHHQHQLKPIPSSPSQPPISSAFVTMDYGIYVIGGSLNDQDRTTDVLLLDCRKNTWSKLPSMGVARAAAGAGVVDGKIYVFGGCDVVDSSNWAEVYDPKTQSWSTFVPLPDRNEGDNLIRETLVMKDKIYAVDLWNGSFCYSPSNGKWGRNKKETLVYFCAIENLLYGCDEYGNVFWRKPEELEWKKVKGLEALRTVFPSTTPVWYSASAKRVRKMSSFGKNIVVFWAGRRRWEVWCAEISLERRKEEGEIRGTIEWSEAVVILDHAPFGKIEVEVLYSATVNV